MYPCEGLSTSEVFRHLVGNGDKVSGLCVDRKICDRSRKRRHACLSIGMYGLILHVKGGLACLVRGDPKKLHILGVRRRYTDDLHNNVIDMETTVLQTPDSR